MRCTLQQTRPTAVQPTPNVLRVAAMFGLGIDDNRQMIIIPPIELDLRAGQIVFVTGPSGGGKTSLLNLIADAAAQCDDASVIRFDQLPDLPDRPLVDCLGDVIRRDADGVGDLGHVLQLLSLAGINDAFVMLRRPCELSDGQRYRLRLAQAFATVSGQRADSARSHLHVLLADEFGATLDRLTAHVIARNLRKWTRRTAGVCFVAATTHDDLLEPLDPDVLVYKEAGQAMEVLSRMPNAQGDDKQSQPIDDRQLPPPARLPKE